MEMGSSEVGFDLQGKSNVDGMVNVPKDKLYGPLWNACAGPFVNLPRREDKVFYFPQGHIEQVAACVNQFADNLDVPNYALSPQILCKVTDVRPQADYETDEVYARITLVPADRANAEGVCAENVEPPAPIPHVYSFCKTLTASDTSTHGGFSVLKRHAEECLPPLDMSQQPPTQELVAKDLHGVQWRFRHIYRGQPKRHLLTSGWSTFVSSKKLVAGDAFIFLRGEDGELRVGARRALRQHHNLSPAIISSQSMQIGLLASAMHSIHGGSIIVVFYRPRTRPADFMIPYDQYMDSLNRNYYIGMKFKMRFEGEEGAEKWFVGTITGLEDVEPIKWPGSKWRCIKVKWDESSTIPRPDRVSPWQIEPLPPSTSVHSSLLNRWKRLRANCLSSSPDSSPGGRDGFFKHTMDSAQAPHGCTGVLQGQEINASGNFSSNGSGPGNAQNIHSSSFPPNHGWESSRDISGYHKQMGLQNCSYLSTINPIFWDMFSRGVSSFPNRLHEDPRLCDYRVPAFSAEGIHGGVGVPHASSNASGFQERTFLQPEAVAHKATPQPAESRMCMIFGVNLMDSSREPMPPSFIGSGDQLLLADKAPQAAPQPVILESDQISEPSKNTRTSDSNGFANALEKRKAHIVTPRSCTKVHKHGTAIGRSVDLSKFDGYIELLLELDRMFDFKGGLVDTSKGWKVIYTDVEGDILQLGSYPWQEFCSRVIKIFLYPFEDVEKNKPCSPISKLLKHHSGNGSPAGEETAMASDWETV